jgi:hypothetical protein
MGIVLERITCFTGILAIATYARNLFALAGCDAYMPFIFGWTGQYIEVLALLQL